jgi:diacylglycerol kinase family enzyme
MEPKKATIIYNPMSGRKGKRAENAAEMIRLLEARGINAEAKATAAPNDATRLTKEAIAKGANLIIGYGGDGTLNEVIQAMVGSDAVLGVWAGGTANVVARDLGLPSDTKQLADIFAAGKTKRIALGYAKQSPASCVPSPLLADESKTSAAVFDLQSADAQGEALEVEQRRKDKGQGTKRYFFMFAGIGLDASIARGVNRKLKRKTGELAFWVSGIKHLLFWKGDKFTVEIDGKTFESAFTLVGNGKSYGGNIEMAKNARLEEPEFEVFIMPRYKINLSYLLALVQCFFRKPEKTGSAMVKSNRLSITSEKEIWVELDGEVVGALPMTFAVLPDALSVIVP